MQIKSAIIVSLLLAVPALSAAQNLTLEGLGPGNAYNLTYNGSTEDAFVGELLFSVNNSATLVPTYCVDLDHFITTGQSFNTTAIQTDTLPSSNAYALAGDILNAGVATATDNNHAAALQIAIWTAIYGNQFSLSGVSSTVEGYEQAYYSAGLSTKSNALYYNAGASGGQSQITTTPEPTSLAVLGIGCVGLFVRRKKA
jgi:hypothetical protein